MNAQKEKTSGVHASSRKPTKKCLMKMKETNKQDKNDTCVKIIFMKGSPYNAHVKNQWKQSTRALWRRLWIH